MTTVAINGLNFCGMLGPGKGMSTPPGMYKVPSPNPPGFIISPLPCNTMASLMVGGTINILIENAPAATLASSFSASIGDTAGTLLGVAFPMVSGPCTPLSGSPTVMLAGAPAFRDTDPLMMNQGNSMCPAFQIPPPFGPSKDADDDPIVKIDLTLSYQSDISVPTKKSDSSYWGG